MTQQGGESVRPITSTSYQVFGSFRDLAASIMTNNGDTVTKAVEEKRCLSEPLGCGASLLKEDGTPKYNHFSSPEEAALYEREWRTTGMCPTCQDRVEAASKAANGECCGNSPCTCQEPPTD